MKIRSSYVNLVFILNLEKKCINIVILVSGPGDERFINVLSTQMHHEKSHL